MSLIVDSLKKVKKEEPDKNPYPIIDVKKKKGKKLFFFLSLFLLVVATSIIYLFIFNGKKDTNRIENLDRVDYSRTTLPPSSVDIKQEEKKENNVSNNYIESSKRQVVVSSNVKKPFKEKSKASIDIEKEFKSYLLSGDKAYLRGDLKKAVTMYEKAIKIKEDIPTYMVLLSLYSQVGDIKKIEKFIKYRDLYPWIDEDIVAITIKNLADSNFKGTIKNIEDEAVKIDETGRIYEAIGYFYEKKGKNALAIHYYKEAYKKNNENPDFLYRFAKILEKTGNKSLAKKLYTELLELDIDPSLRRKVEIILKKLG